MAGVLGIAFFDKGSITVDLDTVIDTGLYYVKDGCTNKPSTSTWDSAPMLVLKNGGNSFCTQLYFTTAYNTIWVRSYVYRSSGFHWTAWKTIQFAS